jgi:diaminopimelate decarboxylase
VDCLFYAEPGRWLCNDAMHILLTVVDKKSEDLVITDGGTNIIGWERFETDYFPVINLSRPSKSEHKCFILGSLCTPHDVWGYGYFGKGIEPGDLLLIPNQGAYTYSLRQEFIKPLPEVVALCSAG